MTPRRHVKGWARSVHGRGYHVFLSDGTTLCGALPRQGFYTPRALQTWHRTCGVCASGVLSTAGEWNRVRILTIPKVQSQDAQP